MTFKQPDTVLNLYRDVPIADGLQLAFQNTNEQAAYFNARRVKQVTGMTHINNTRGSVRISAEVREAITCNYLSFNNLAFESKPMYAQIINVDQVNHSTIEVFFEIDWWQTMQFDAQYRPSMIVRQHLTQAQYDLAAANPYRGDIVELLTTEDLTVTDDLEVDYTRDKGVVTVGGLPKNAYRASGVDRMPYGALPRPAAGSTLVQQFGTTSYGPIGSEEPNPHAIVLKLASWDQFQLFLADMNAVQNISNPSMVGATDTYFENGYGRAFRLFYIYGDNTTLAQGDMSVILQTAIDWLTEKGLTSQLLGAYMVPLDLLAGDIATIGTDTGATVFPGHAWSGRYTKSVTTIGVNVTTYGEDVGYEPLNTKLYRAPYRTLRAVSPNGTEHHFPIEDFGPSSFGVAATFTLYHSFDDGPEQTLVANSAGGYSIDYKNRLVYNSFPQLSYNIDGYLTYLSSTYQAAILADSAGSKVVRDTMGKDWGAMGAAVGGHKDIKADLMGGNIGGAFASAQDNQLQPQLMRDAYASQNLDGGEVQQVRRGDAVSVPLEHHRQATRADAYVAGNAGGSLGVRLNQSFWEIIKVTLKPEILKIYDEYFTTYGYRAGYLGVPRVAEWVAGGELPWFGPHGSYCKTDNLKVYGVYAPAARYIADLFNGGCRFVKGN